jgi:hypothetical protein
VLDRLPEIAATLFYGRRRSLAAPARHPIDRPVRRDGGWRVAIGEARWAPYPTARRTMDDDDAPLPVLVARAGGCAGTAATKTSTSCLTGLADALGDAIVRCSSLGD